MRLIDADKLIKKKFRIMLSDGFRADEYVVKEKAIRDAPTVDAVLVVRCENCDSYREPDDDHAYCTNHLRETEADDYCSYGIRKDWERGTD